MPPVPGSLTRRELLVAGAGASAALLLVGCGASDSAPQQRMAKGISLAGDLNRYDEALGVRPYLLGGPHPIAFLSLWASWPTLQPQAPDPFTRAQAFRDLSDPAGPGAATLAVLDAQIERANRDGLGAALIVYQSFPDWSHPSAPLDPTRDPAIGGRGYPELGQSGLENEARLPDDLSPDGPWAWLVAYLCARYAHTDGAATPGPGRDGAQVGNPRGARLDWLQPMNEPNLTWWPQRSPLLPGGTCAGAVAKLARSAAVVASDVAGSPGLLIPGTSDVGTPVAPHGTPWDVFSDELLRRLRGWRPAVPVGWAHHNWVDVKYGPRESGRWRVEDLLAMQRRHDWPDPSIWITEGGYQFTVRRDGPDRFLVDPAGTADSAQPDVYAEQVAKLTANWHAMARLPVRLWSQYQVHDGATRFQSALRGPVRTAASGTVSPAADPYPAYALWPKLRA